MGKVTNNGTVEAGNQVIGRVLANGLVKDAAGGKVVARMVRGGLVSVTAANISVIWMLTAK